MTDRTGRPRFDLPGGTPWVLGVMAMAVLGLAARLVTLPVAPDVDDSFLFVQAVVRFSLIETRPHWPGYPVYIWAGKLVNAVVSDPVRSLHLVSAVASSLLSWPLAAVARAWAVSIGASAEGAVRAGWAAAALWLVTPVALVTGSQILSDPLGLLLGMVLLVCCVRGERDDNAALWTGAAALGGFMLGVRLVNVTMLGPLVWKAWRLRSVRLSMAPAPLVLLCAFLAGAAPWAAWMLLREPAVLTYHARSHVGGHFTRWGETLLTDEQPLLRPVRALRTLAVYGLGAGGPEMGWWRVVAGVAWLATLVRAAAVLARRRQGTPVAWVVGLWAWPHLLYVFAAHDVAYPRYMLSSVALLCVLGGLALARPGSAGMVALGVAVFASAAVSGPLALLQQRQPSAEYRVARFLGQQPRAAIVVVGEPGLTFYLERVAEGLEWAVAPATDVPSWRARWEAEGRQVFTTVPPPQDPAGWRPVAHFCRDPLIDPRLGHDLWLFAPMSASVPALADECERGQ